MMEAAQRFSAYLRHQGYDPALVDHLGTSYSHKMSLERSVASNISLRLDFHYCQSRMEVHEKHLRIWNQNNSIAFVAVGDNFTWVIDGRTKPPIDPNQEPIKLDSFDYGINNFEFDSGIRKILGKEQVDLGFFFEFVANRQKKHIRSVDRDLLINLLGLRRDLKNQGLGDEVVHLLLLKCLFVKFLEDRGILEAGTLLNAIQTSSPKGLLRLFNKIKRLNGDIFGKYDIIADDLNKGVLERLTSFFGYYDYQSGQGKIFPYQFDQIPVQLIGSIYESFLNDQTKKEGGIYYTPRHLVQFMLANSLSPKLIENRDITIMDPACGSGAFLVETYRMLIEARNVRHNYEEKKQILQSQIFGIDWDKRALQIAAFSLYLELLDGQDRNFLKNQIEDKAAILPHLIGKTLICANSLIEDVNFTMGDDRPIHTFDCIVGNPPWGSIPPDTNAENILMRAAMGSGSTNSKYPEYASVSQYQRSQAFLLRSSVWCKESGSTLAIVVNNSIFFNSLAIGFRQTLLSKYEVNDFFELSGVNEILFRKYTAGKIGDEEIKVGANEPCAILFMNFPKSNAETRMRYIRPKINPLSRLLNLISFGSGDIVEAKQSDFHEDNLWRIFAKGSWEDYQLIQKRIYARDKKLSVTATLGINPKEIGGTVSSTPEIWKLIQPKNLGRWQFNTNNLGEFDRSKKIERPRNEVAIFKGERILGEKRIYPSNGARLSFSRVKIAALCKDNVITIKANKSGKNSKASLISILGILNSKFGFYLVCNLSAQLGKSGGEKRDSLLTEDIKKIPFPDFEKKPALTNELNETVKKIEGLVLKGKSVSDLEAKIDEIVNKLYELTIYERLLVEEYLSVNFHASKSEGEVLTLFGSKKVALQNPRNFANLVTDKDLRNYISQFSKTLSLILKEGYVIDGRFNVSPNLGAVACFSIREQHSPAPQNKLSDLLSVIKKIQVENVFFFNQLNEEKVKYYDKENQLLYIVKTNQFRDWTGRKAIDDANEEIGQTLKYWRDK